jgi:hypothetical protein
MARPRIYNTVEELEAAVEDYFTKEIVEVDCGSHQVKGVNKKPSVNGLALHLGFADKSTLYEYRDRPEFSYPIKRALTMIEMYHEERLSENNVTGAIFALKNMGWRDKSEQDLKVQGGVQVIMERVGPDYESKEG